MTNLLHKYKCIFILVPKNPKNLFQLLDISVNKVAECFLEDEYQNWCANEVCIETTGQRRGNAM